MSDTVWLALIGVVVMVLKEYFDRQRGLFVIAETKKMADVTTLASRQAHDAAQSAATEVKKVKITLANTTTVTESKLNETLVTLNTVHKLVNNETHIALTTIARLQQQVADLTGKPEDAMAAKAAHEDLARHDDRQADADSTTEKR